MTPKIRSIIGHCSWVSWAMLLCITLVLPSMGIRLNRLPTVGGHQSWRPCLLLPHRKGAAACNEQHPVLRLRGGTESGEDAEMWLDAQVHKWRELSSPPHGDGSATEPTRHIFEIELDVAAPLGSVPAASAPPYAPGDCIAIRAPNPSALVIALVALLPSREVIECKCEQGAAAGMEHGAEVLPATYPAALRELLHRRLTATELVELIWERDLSALTKLSLRGLAAHCSLQEDAAQLLQLASSQHDYNARIQSPAINIVELLRAFPSCRPSLMTVLKILPPLTPRSYSISSTPLQYPSSSPESFSLKFVFALVNRTLMRDDPGIGEAVEWRSCQTIRASSGVGGGDEREEGVEGGSNAMCGILNLYNLLVGRVTGSSADTSTGARTSSRIGSLISSLLQTVDSTLRSIRGSSSNSNSSRAGNLHKTLHIYRPGHCTGFLHTVCQMMGSKEEQGALTSNMQSRFKVLLKRAEKFQLPPDPRSPMVRFLIILGDGGQAFRKFQK